MRRVVGTGAIALIVGLAGCSGGGDQPAQTLPPTATTSSDPATVVPPPSSSTPTATAMPSPVKPTLPAAAKVHSRAGAKAMAEYWLYALDYALGTGDTKPMWTVSKRSCHTCTNYSNAVETIIREGGSITPLHKARVLSADVISYSTEAAQTMTTYITGQSRARIPKKHIDRPNDPPTRARAKIATSWTGRSWVVDEVYNP